MPPSKPNPLENTLASILARRGSRNQLRQLPPPPDPQTTATTKPPIDFSSNDYLSLSTSPLLHRTYLSHLHHHLDHSPPISTPTPTQAPPNFQLGSTASRLLFPPSSPAHALLCHLETTIADFHHAPAGLLFNSAMDANIGLLSCVPQPGDVVLYDELVHASVHDGMRGSRVGRGARLKFRHNVVREREGWREGVERDGEVEQRGEGAGRSLEGLLREVVKEERFRESKRNVFVVVEGVYSMDGDIAPLREVIEVVEEWLPAGNGYVIVDEAHSVGVLGQQGRGLVCELGLEDRVWARVLGFGKAMGCSGGIVLCSETTRLYLINYARTLIYTTAMSFPSLINIKIAYEFLISGQAEPLLARLRRLARTAHRLLLTLCHRHQPPPNLLRINTAEPKSPIIPVFTSLPRGLAKYCQDRGFMIRPIVPPTVPKGKERIRICLHAGNTEEEVRGLVGAMDDWVIGWMLGVNTPEHVDQEDISGLLLTLAEGKREKGKL